MSDATVHIERDGDLVVLTVSNPPVNTIDVGVRAALNEALGQIESDASVKAAVLLCAGSTFFSGADINEFSGPPQEAAYRALFNRLEALPFPLVVGLHGTVMGGGLEIALAGHYRIAHANSRFCFPEVTLGIIPGAGGTQRMPRLIGVEKTLDMIISAKPVDAATAVALGFVDALVDSDLRAAAMVAAQARIGRVIRRTGALMVDPATATVEMLEAARTRARKLYPHRQAALTAIDVVAASVRLSFAEGLEYETERANETKLTVESKAAIHVFFAERATRKIPGLPSATVGRPVHQVAVIGAGTMGGGIAVCFANAGIAVTILDRKAEDLAAGLRRIEATYASMVQRGRLSAEEKVARLALITGTLHYRDLATADLVVEAAFEDMALKQSIFRELERVTRPGTVLATNTSSLDIAELAQATTRPGDVIGMHFFSPAQVMPLLEVIRTETTSPQTIKTVMELAKPLRKTPVLAKVCYGFIGNRMMEGYAREAQRIVLEGATPAQVDAALEDFGMAMGILAVFDMAGIDVGVNVHRANAAQYPPDPAYYQADVALYEAGRLGQKNGKGYYQYRPGDRKRYDDPEALALIRARAAHLGVPQRTHTREEIVERCVYPLLNEAFRILAEGIALRAADIDVVWATGYGFPRWRGGPMFYASTIGLRTLLDGMNKYKAAFGPMHWEPARLLEQLVRDGQTVSEWEAIRSEP